MRVIIADPKKSECEQLAGLLLDLPVDRVSFCHDYAGFRHLLENSSFDLVFCAAGMHDKTAADFFRLFRAYNKYAPFMVHLNEASAHEVVSWFKTGVTDVVSIANPGLFPLQIERALRESRLQSTLESLRVQPGGQPVLAGHNNEHYRKVVENQAEMIVRWDVSGMVRFANASFLAYHSITFDELAAQSYYNFVDDKERFLTKIGSLTAENPQVIDVHTHKHPTFGNVWHEWSDHGFFGPAGELLEIQSIGRDITQQKVLEFDIRESEEFSQAVLSSLQSNIAVIERSGVIIATNDAWRSFVTGNEALLIQTYVGMNYFDVCGEAVACGEEVAALALAGIHDVLDKKIPAFDIEFSCPSPGGLRWFLMHVSPFTARLEGAVISHTDITEKKVQQELLRENEERFKRIFESIHDVYYQVRPDGEILLISPSVFGLLGFTAAELVGTSLANYYVNPGLREMYVSRLKKETGSSVQFEAAMITKDGKEVIVSVNLSMIFGDNEWLLQGLMRNITEKKRQEIRLESRRLQLLEANRLNTQIIETSDRFFYVMIAGQEPTDHALKYISQQVRTIAGLTETEVMLERNAWYANIHPDDLVLLNNGMQSLSRYRQPVEMEYRLFNPKLQRYAWVEDYACPSLDAASKIVEIYGSVKDITERKNAEAKIENEKRQALAYQFQLLSSQLNPHFIYNTLNSFQYFILNGNIEESLNHISDFSVLMRKMLENSIYQYITLEDELKFLKQFISVSKQRMKTELAFDIIIDPGIEVSEVCIPPMLLQPHIENSIIHGFSGSPRDPRIVVIIKKIRDRVFCSIEDNGIGRAASQKQRELREQLGQHSFTIGVNQKRINLLNQITQNDFRYEVLDVMDKNGEVAGTRTVLNYCYFGPESQEEE
jgi:PAS domain S-box-containing protein